MRINVWILVAAGWTVLISGTWCGINIFKKSSEVSEWKEKFFQCQALLISSDEKVKEKDAIILKGTLGNNALVESIRAHVVEIEDEKAEIERKHDNLLKENSDLKFQVENLVLGIKKERENKEETVEIYNKLVEYTKKIMKNRDEWKFAADNYYQVALENADAANQARLSQYYQQLQQTKSQTLQLPRMIVDENGNQYRTVNRGGGVISVEKN